MLPQFPSALSPQLSEGLNPTGWVRFEIKYAVLEFRKGWGWRGEWTGNKP